ncbi:MAG TPA: DUF4440 domain-containing protein [Terriglobales bacterium]|nr:DUF4440 domain-containing protein [Terriglobales bacterium]
MKTIAFIIAAAMLATSGSVVAQAPMTMSAEQREVWAGEEAYSRYLMNHDLEGYMSLWDERFIGWPYARSTPGTKADIREAVAQDLAETQHSEPVPTPLAVNVFGNVANTYYILRSKSTDKSGKTAEHAYRISHTWQRTDGKWKIIGGMSAPHEKPDK